MFFAVGLGWSWVFGILMVVALIVGIIWLIRQISEDDSKIGPIVLIVLGLILVYFWTYAAGHVMVHINERALLIKTAQQEVIGVREGGIQSKPWIVKVIKWPANTQYPLTLKMENGVASATTKNGTSIIDEVTVYLNLSEMDIESAYKAVNGNWDVFSEKNLIPGLLSVCRSVSKDFTTDEHSTKKDEWQKKFEEAAILYLSDPNQGFNVKLISSRTVMSWDFVNEADAKAFDEANQAAYQITKNLNKKAALDIEAQMVEIQNQMKTDTANGTIITLEIISKYLQNQPEEIRPYLISYLKNMENMEYLRIVGNGGYEVILPPNGSAIVSTNTASDSSLTTTPPTTSTQTPED